jgi:hypothetical protein
MLKVIGILVLSATLIAQAAASEKPKCETEAELRTRIAASARDVTFETLNATLYMALFNALPPATQTAPPERLIAARSPEKKTVLLFGFKGGCLDLSGAVAALQHTKIMTLLGAEI